MIENHLWKFFSPELQMTAFTESSRILLGLLTLHKPKLAHHLNSFSVDLVTILPPFFTVLGSGLQCWETVLRIIDIFVLEGEVAIYRLIWALFQVNEGNNDKNYIRIRKCSVFLLVLTYNIRFKDKILQVTDVSDLMSILLHLDHHPHLTSQDFLEIVSNVDGKIFEKKRMPPPSSSSTRKRKLNQTTPTTFAEKTSAKLSRISPYIKNPLNNLNLGAYLYPKETKEKDKENILPTVSNFRDFATPKRVGNHGEIIGSPPVKNMIELQVLNPMSKKRTKPSDLPSPLKKVRRQTLM
eukprot:TRINITY_DN3105_c0_g1_i2.p1 TRINITY_DN3105_c0_g1~~TRINITY_DN3105_c0_g1_i2.p1  ORF type:complete len:296 (-),score=68.41 TRINITY_DN3105_c0_g1_i2:191-1078(-)